MMGDMRGAPYRLRVAQSTAAVGVVVGLLALGAGQVQAKSHPPKPVPAWYMTAANVTDLVRQAKNNACAFAKQQPKSSRLMLFDFGAARKYRDGTFGATLREIRRFRNGGILKALKEAARKYQHCHRRGSAKIAYGNTNSMPGYMNKADAHEAGLHQAATITRLRRFQRQHHYGSQSAATAGDIEPGFGFPGVTKALVAGANGATKYYDFGNAGGCPGQPGAQGCLNGWDVGDLGEVSMGGRSRPLPEIYRPYEATQWARIQRRWKGKYFFAGVTAAPDVPLSPAESWTMLKHRADNLHRELVSIRNAGTRSASSRARASREALGAPMTGTTPAHLEASPEGFFSTSLIYPLRNEWVAADHRRFLAVDAGAEPLDPTTGVLGIFRQNYVNVTQSQRLVRMPGAGALELTGAPAGSARAALNGPGTTLRFTSERGVSGTLDVSAGEVTLDSSPTDSP